MTTTRSLEAGFPISVFVLASRLMSTIFATLSNTIGSNFLSAAIIDLRSSLSRLTLVLAVLYRTANSTVGDDAISNSDAERGMRYDGATEEDLNLALA